MREQNFHYRDTPAEVQVCVSGVKHWLSSGYGGVIMCALHGVRVCSFGASFRMVPPSRTGCLLAVGWDRRWEKSFRQKKRECACASQEMIVYRVCSYGGERRKINNQWFSGLEFPADCWDPKDVDLGKLLRLHLRETGIQAGKKQLESEVRSSLATSERGAWMVNRATELEEGRDCYMGESRSRAFGSLNPVKPRSLLTLSQFPLASAPPLTCQNRACQSWNTGAQASSGGPSPLP